MTSGDIHAGLAKEALGLHPSEDDALALMILLHTHHIWLSKPMLQDRPKVMDLAAITQRHTAAVVAAIWPDQSDARRTDRRYWLNMFIARTPYELIENVPEDWMIRVRLLRERLIENPLIDRLEPED